MFKFLADSFLKNSGISDELEYKHNIRMNYATTIKDKRSLEQEKKSVRTTIGGDSSEGRLRLQSLNEIDKIYSTFKGLDKEITKQKLSTLNDKNRKFHEAILENLTEPEFLLPFVLFKSHSLSKLTRISAYLSYKLTGRNDVFKGIKPILSSCV